jgi:hypothetical protein
MHLLAYKKKKDQDTGWTIEDSNFGRCRIFFSFFKLKASLLFNGYGCLLPSG